MDGMAVDSLGGLVLQLLKHFLSFDLFSLLFLVDFDRGVIGVDDDQAVRAVYNAHFPICILRIVCLNDSRNAHRAGQDRGVGAAGAMPCDKGKHQGFVQLHCFRRSQIVRKKDRRLCRIEAGIASALQHGYHAVAHIQNVPCPGLHVFVVHHGLEHLGHIVPGTSHRKLCVYALVFNDLLSLLDQIQIVQKQLMGFKQSRLGLTDLL